MPLLHFILNPQLNNLSSPNQIKTNKVKQRKNGKKKKKPKNETNRKAMPHCRRPMTVLPSMLRSLFLSSVCVMLLSRGGPVLVAMVHGKEVATAEAADVVVNADESEAADQATLTLEVYDTEHNFRQSFCDRYALLYNDTSYLAWLGNTVATSTADAETDAAGDAIKTTIANVLSGTNLNLIVADDTIHFNYEEGIGINTTVPGLHADILDYMAEQSNFTWRESFGIMYGTDIQDPNTFTTYLDWSTERYDMVIDYFAPSLERMQMGVTFTESYINGDMLLIKNQYTQPEAKINWWNWLSPFTNEVWCATLATILISAMIYPWIEYMGGGLDNFLTIRKWITNRLYKSFINFTGNYAYVSFVGNIFYLYLYLKQLN